ncbi:MAG: GNAT family N-acetyltransferase [Anaerolineae bacterium]|nr:GNAT family N-acetyltransferase [Anaerolineae bacterium]
MSDITVRLATLSDVRAITGIHCSTVKMWHDPKSGRVKQYEDLDLFGHWCNGGPWMSVELCAIHLNALLLRGHLPLVAEVAGQVVGEAEFLIDQEPPPFGPCLHLSILYVHQDMQHKGVGRALLAAGEQHARTLGLMTLTTQPESEAVDFYTRAGYSLWLRGQEMQLKAEGVPPTSLKTVDVNTELPVGLALRVGRYQCGVQAWDTLWPSLLLPGWSNLWRGIWRGELAMTPVVLALREQLHDPTQADGYVWLPVEASLISAIAALKALAAEKGFKAVDMLLLEEDIPTVRSAFRLDYQTSVTLWHKVLF